MSPVAVYASYFAWAFVGSLVAVGLAWEFRNEVRLYRRRREATLRAEARRERIAVGAAITRQGMNDAQKGLYR